MNYNINYFFGRNPLASAGKLRQCHPQIFLGADEVDIRWHSGEFIWPSCSSIAWGWARAIWRTRAVWHLRAPPTVSENWILYRNKRKCSRPGFRCKSVFFQGSSTFLHDTTRKNGNLPAFRRFLRLRFLHRSLCQLGLLLGLGKQARALDNHLAHPQSKHS